MFFARHIFVTAVRKASGLSLHTQHDDAKIETYIFFKLPAKNKVKSVFHVKYRIFCASMTISGSITLKM